MCRAGRECRTATRHHRKPSARWFRTLLSRLGSEKFDAIVTGMYRTIQGHIPFKDAGIYDTGRKYHARFADHLRRPRWTTAQPLTLPGQGKAEPSSLYSAIKVAADMAVGNLKGAAQ